jgi:MFS family permease
LFTVYVVVLLVTLVFLGSASDYLGRRPVMLAALALGAVACDFSSLRTGLGCHSRVARCKASPLA